MAESELDLEITYMENEGTFPFQIFPYTKQMISHPLLKLVKL